MEASPPAAAVERRERGRRHRLEEGLAPEEEVAGPEQLRQPGAREGRRERAACRKVQYVERVERLSLDSLQRPGVRGPQDHFAIVRGERDRPEPRLRPGPEPVLEGRAV